MHAGDDEHDDNTAGQNTHPRTACEKHSHGHNTPSCTTTDRQQPCTQNVKCLRDFGGIKDAHTIMFTFRRFTIRRDAPNRP